MNTFTIIIEEHISQECTIQADTPKEAEQLAEKLYKEGKLVLEPGNLLDVTFTVME